jgi:ABC-type cobalamin/Fe3+-siderophores transport system ATPase subunit
MAFNFNVPLVNGTTINFDLAIGEAVFILGANGTGKSSLLQRFDNQHGSQSRRISAHRQMWFDADLVNMSAGESRNARLNVRAYDNDPTSRFRDPYHTQRPNLAIYDLTDSENTRARAITTAMDKDDIPSAVALSKAIAPIKKLNDLFQISNLAIRLSIHDGPEVKASRSGGPAYSIAHLSDGERNALLISAEVLTAKAGTLLIIDEPERHLHRSIMSPMLTALFAERPDCAFVISTHDVGLAHDNAQSKTLLLRNCAYGPNGIITGWDADLLVKHDNLDDQLLVEVLGARRKALFVEGDQQSLDKALYSLIFPDVSVIPKGSCKYVEQAVLAIRVAQNLHWIAAFGLIDNDNRLQTDIAALKTRHVYAVSSHSVESVYYHPEIQKHIAIRHAGVTGTDPNTLIADAKNAALLSLLPHAQRLSERAVESALRAQVMQSLPRREDIAAARPIAVSIDVAAVVSAEKAKFDVFLAAKDLEQIIARYPVRETGALTGIAQKLGFQNRAQYESAVRKLMIDVPEALDFVRGLFGTLAADLAAA